MAAIPASVRGFPPKWIDEGRVLTSTQVCDVTNGCILAPSGHWREKSRLGRRFRWIEPEPLEVGPAAAHCCSQVHGTLVSHLVVREPHREKRVILLKSPRDSRRFAVLLVSHDLHVVMAKSDRVICINQHVCCSGVPVTVAKDPEYARLFGHEAARAFAIYQHEHDHRHDLSGRPTAPEQ